MEQYVIKGGNPLVGEVEIGGAKNAALAIISAAVMTDETVTIENLPNVRDINVLLNAISDIGAKVDRLDAHTVKMNGSFIHNLVAILCVRIPGVYLTSKFFPDTLFPMGLATATGSLLSVIICVIFFGWLKRRERSRKKITSV